MKTPPKTQRQGLRSPILTWVGAAGIVILVALVVVAEWYPGRDKPVVPDAAAPVPPVAQPQTAGAPPSNFYAQIGTPVLTMGPANPKATSEEEIKTVVGNIGEKFHVDAKGRLVQNEKTRLHIEALLALTDPAKLYDAVEEEIRNLPPAAAERARELVRRYQNYIEDQQKLIPPGVAPVNEDEALAQIDALHRLRTAHFGTQTAEAFYGDEEKLNQELVELMRIEKDPTLTMEQKAERAQSRYDQLHRARQAQGTR